MDFARSSAILASFLDSSTRNSASLTSFKVALAFPKWRENEETGKRQLDKKKLYCKQQKTYK